MEMSAHSSLPIPRVGVGIVIRRSDELLLVRLHQAHGEDAWSTPGGYLEYGESPEDCAARWAFEEAGVIASGIRFLAMTHDFLPEQEEHLITLWMVTWQTGSEGAVTPPDAGTEVRWFPLDRLPQPLFPCFEHLLRVTASPSGSEADGVCTVRDYSVVASKESR